MYPCVMRKFLASYGETHIALKQRNNIFTPLVFSDFSLVSECPLPPPNHLTHLINRGFYYYYFLFYYFATHNELQAE